MREGEKEPGASIQESGDGAPESVDEFKVLYFAQILRDVLVRLVEEQCIDLSEPTSKPVSINDSLPSTIIPTQQ